MPLSDTLNEYQKKLNQQTDWDFSHLKALFLNCTLKKSPRMSHTSGLIEMSSEIMKKNGMAVESIRPVDLNIAYGVYPDMTEYGWEKDDWPDLFRKVMDTDILILTTPIWLGEKSSIATKIVERLYAQSAELNEKGQYLYYGKVGACLVTGNEDGGKHCSMNLIYSLQHLGFTIPPQADAYWVGEAGPGPSYLDEDSNGPQNDFTRRNTTFMTWNARHMANMLKESGGIPAHGNQKTEWKAGCHKENENPEHRS